MTPSGSSSRHSLVPMCPFSSFNFPEFDPKRYKARVVSKPTLIGP